MGCNELSQHSFIYRMKMDYNKLNRNIMLSPNVKIFKKYIDKHMLETQQKIPVRKDNSIYTLYSLSDITNINVCQGHVD